MKNLKSSLAVCSIVSVLFSQKIITGDVIVINRCNEPLVVVHVKDIKGNKKYNIEPEESELKLIDNKNLEKDKNFSEVKKIKVKKDRESGYKKIDKLRTDELFKATLKVGEFLVLRNVDFANNEKVWAKGDSWMRILGTKNHYRSFHLKNGDYIVFVNKAATTLGIGSLDFNAIKIDSKKEDLIKKLNYIYSDVAPVIFDLHKLGDDKLKELGNTVLGENLGKVQLFSKTLNKIEILKENFKDLISKIDLLEIRIKVILGKEKQEVLTNKKIKNFRQDVLLSYMAIVRKIILSKVDITKNLESYQSDDIANIVLVAMHM
ncbi:MAG: hypothetical protein ACD_82C00038G0003, partial [uncultured bacterium]